MIDRLTHNLMVAANESMLTDTCTVVEQVMLSDGGGGSYPDPDGPKLTDLACRFTPVSAISDREVQAAVVTHGSYLLEVPLQATITAATVIRYQSRDYTVTWSPTADAWSFVRMAVLKER